jgi:hypothetical protein
MTDPAEEFALEAIINRMWSHTVGVVNEKRRVGTLPDGRGFDEEQPGTGSAIKWGQHHCLLTASHVIGDAAPSDLRFFFRPVRTLDRKSREDIERGGYVEFHSGCSIDIYNIFRCDWEDIAVLTINPGFKYLNAEFHDFKSGWRDALEGATVCSFGFPTHEPLTVEVTRTGDREQRILGLSPLVWESKVTPKPSSLIESYSAENPFNAERHFLAPWNVTDQTMTPHGFSGAATWMLPQITKGVWSSNLICAGMCTLYYPKHRIKRMIKASVVAKFLEEVLGLG